MTHHLRVVRLCAALAGMALAVCGCKDERLFAPNGSANVLQVVSVTPAPSSPSCLQGAPEVLIKVRLVNTTSTDVTVSQVASTGVLLDGTTNNRIALQFDQLPFTPVLVRARDGDVATQVTLKPPCTVLGRIQTQLFLTTEPSGIIATPFFYITVTNF